MKAYINPRCFCVHVHMHTLGLTFLTPNGQKKAELLSMWRENAQGTHTHTRPLLLQLDLAIELLVVCLEDITWQSPLCCTKTKGPHYTSNHPFLVFATCAVLFLLSLFLIHFCGSRFLSLISLPYFFYPHSIYWRPTLPP